jgi:hypothetical protein
MTSTQSKKVPEGGQYANLNSEFSMNSNVNSKKPAAVRSVKAHWMFPMKTVKGRVRKKSQKSSKSVVIIIKIEFKKDVPAGMRAPNFHKQNE